MKNLILLFVSVCLLMSAYSCNQGGGKDQGKDEHEKKQAATENAEKTPEQTTTAEADPGANEPEQPEVRNPETEATPEPFDHLTKMYLSENKRIMIKYNPDHTEIINKEIDELSENDPFKQIASGLFAGTIALKTKIKENGADYVVVYSPGPSADPTFMFYKDGNFNQLAFSVPATNLFIPGNGNLYSEGYAALNNDVRRKYIFSNNDIEEVNQPFYYVGKKTSTKQAIKLYATPKMEQVIASIPANYSIEIVLEHPDKPMLLIKTKFGLVGWKKLNLRGLSSDDIKGLRTASD